MKDGKFGDHCTDDFDPTVRIQSLRIIERMPSAYHRCAAANLLRARPAPSVEGIISADKTFEKNVLPSKSYLDFDCTIKPHR